MTEAQKEYTWNRAPARHGGYIYDICETGEHILIAFSKEKAIEIVNILNTGSVKESSDKVLENLRNAGWVVAIHNDYHQNGELHTFWLMTHPNGNYLKGEGKTDCEALSQIEELREQRERER